jgi:hypothetical protein
MEIITWVCSFTAGIVVVIGIIVIDILRRLENFEQWLRKNNPNGEIDITFANGDRYKLKIDKESKSK